MIAIVACMVLFVWSMIDWYLASLKHSWLWVVTPFAWILLLIGVVLLAGPMTMAVVDRPLPIGGEMYVFPAAVVVSGAGMVLNKLTFWRQMGRGLWTRSQ